MASPRKRRTPRQRHKRRSTSKEAIILIPLTYNDGTAVPVRVVSAIRDELYQAFDGWTIEGTVKGAYRMRSGERRVEDLLKVSVVLPEARVPELEGMIGRWCRTLGQETMLLRIADHVIRFVRPRKEEEP